MTVLVVTLFKENYGAFLQTYAFTNYLKSMGYNVLCKDYEYTGHSDIQKQIIEIGKQEFSYYNNDNIDLIICGSDEIWNIGNSACTDRMDFWGKGLDRKTKIISYAPSAAGTGSQNNFQGMAT